MCKALCESGFSVHAIDNNLEQNNILPYVNRLEKIDIREPFVLNDHYHTVIHLAALTRIEPSISNPFPYYVTNVVGTQNVINSCTTDHFLYGSTGSAFNPEASPYSMSKRAAEHLLHNMNYTACRFYNVSGNAGFDKFDNSYYHLIRKAAAVANRKYPGIKVYGSDFDTPDGTTIRNYTHIADIVDAMVSLVKHGATNSVECLGAKRGYSVLEVLLAMEEVCGRELKKHFCEARKGDVAVSVLPEQSKFFKENHSLEDQCRSAMETEK
jgi:UDP-glucose 4-epimerase